MDLPSNTGFNYAKLEGFPSKVVRLLIHVVRHVLRRNFRHIILCAPRLSIVLSRGLPGGGVGGGEGVGMVTVGIEPCINREVYFFGLSKMPHL